MGAGVEYGLGGLFDGAAVFVSAWLASEAGPWEVVVDSRRIAVVTFHSSAYGSHPCVVHSA